MEKKTVSMTILKRDYAVSGDELTKIKAAIDSGDGAVGIKDKRGYNVYPNVAVERFGATKKPKPKPKSKPEPVPTPEVVAPTDMNGYLQNVESVLEKLKADLEAAEKVVDELRAEVELAERVVAAVRGALGQPD